MEADFHFRGGPLAVAGRVAGKSRPRSKTSEEAEEEPERKGALSEDCGEDGTEKHE